MRPRRRSQPVSRILSPFDSALPCGSASLRGDDHSSGPVIADGIKRPTRRPGAGSPHNASLFGLAPCGVLPATRVTAGAVRSYRTFSPLPSSARRFLSVPASYGEVHPCGPASTKREARSRAVYFLCHFPSGHPDRALPGALPCGVRTFLPFPGSPAACATGRPASGGRLASCGGLSKIPPSPAFARLAGFVEAGPRYPSVSWLIL